MTICNIEGCGKRHSAHGLCAMHNYRLKKFGDTSVVRLKGVTPRPAIERLTAMLRDEDGCWIFTGALDRRGYGRIGTPDGSALVHRVTYSYYIGDHPEGLELDHLCRRPSCCNPWHLDPVTHVVNVQRGRAGWATNDLCKHGHDLTDPDNVYVHTKGSAGRKCKTCTLRRARAQHQRKKEQAA